MQGKQMLIFQILYSMTYGKLSKNRLKEEIHSVLMEGIWIKSEIVLR